MSGYWMYCQNADCKEYVDGLNCGICGWKQPDETVPESDYAAVVAERDALRDELGATTAERNAWAQKCGKDAREIKALNAELEALKVQKPIGYFAGGGGRNFNEVDPKWSGEPDVIPLFARPVPAAAVPADQPENSARYLWATALEDNADILYSVVISHAPDQEKINKSVDEYRSAVSHVDGEKA